MFIYKNGLIGSTPIFDREFLTIGEKDRVSPQWNNSIKVYYDLNQQGHRCKDISELNQDYILFTGCSHTLGAGLPLENTFPYIVAKHYNIDYYNLGLLGGSVETTCYNLISFITKVKIKPKMVFIQWTGPNRILFYHNDNNLHTCIPSAISDEYEYSEVYKTMLKHNVPQNQSIFYKKFTLDILNNLGIDTYQISDVIPFNDRNYPDFARDGAHAGINTNIIWANKIIDFVDKKI